MLEVVGKVPRQHLHFISSFLPHNVGGPSNLCCCTDPRTVGNMIQLDGFLKGIDKLILK